MCNREEQPTPVLRAPTTFIQPGRMGMGMTGLKMVQVHQPAPQSTPASPSPTARTPRQYPDPAPYWGTSSPRLPNATAPAFYAPPLTQSTSAVSDTSWLLLGCMKVYVFSRSRAGFCIFSCQLQGRVGGFNQQICKPGALSETVESQVVSARPGRCTSTEICAAAPAQPHRCKSC